MRLQGVRCTAKSARWRWSDIPRVFFGVRCVRGGYAVLVLKNPSESLRNGLSPIAVSAGLAVPRRPCSTARERLRPFCRNQFVIGAAVGVIAGARWSASTGASAIATGCCIVVALTTFTGVGRRLPRWSGFAVLAVSAAAVGAIGATFVVVLVAFTMPGTSRRCVADVVGRVRNSAWSLLLRAALMFRRSRVAMTGAAISELHGSQRCNHRCPDVCVGIGVAMAQLTSGGLQYLLIPYDPLVRGSIRHGHHGCRDVVGRRGGGGLRQQWLWVAVELRHGRRCIAVKCSWRSHSLEGSRCTR